MFFFQLIMATTSAVNTSTNSSLNPSVLLTVSATLFGSFIGAGAAQYFSHRLANNRENIKNLKESYQKLFAPIITEVFEFYDITTKYRTHHLKWGVSNKTYLSKIIDHIANNLIYATPQLILSYHEFRNTEYVEDNSGFSEDMKKLILIKSFIDELITIAQKSSLFDNSTINRLAKYSFYYYFWKELIPVFQSSEVGGFIRHHVSLDDSKLNIKNYKTLVKSYEANQPEFWRNPIDLIKPLLKESSGSKLLEEEIEKIRTYSNANKDEHLSYEINPNRLMIAIYNCKVEGNIILMELDVSNYSNSLKVVSKYDFYLQLKILFSKWETPINLSSEPNQNK